MYRVEIEPHGRDCPTYFETNHIASAFLWPCEWRSSEGPVFAQRTWEPISLDGDTVKTRYLGLRRIGELPALRLNPARLR